MVPGGRVELPLSCENQILSLARLPVPPSGLAHDIAVLAAEAVRCSWASVITVLSLAAAAFKSVSSIVFYRRHIFSDLCPMIDMAVVLSTPARRSAVAAQCRRS